MSNHHRTRARDSTRRKLPPYGERVAFYLSTGSFPRWLFGYREQGGAGSYQWRCSEAGAVYRAADVSHWRAEFSTPPKIQERGKKVEVPAMPRRRHAAYGAGAWRMDEERFRAATKEMRGEA